MLGTVNDLVANKKISAREPIQVLAPLQYVFTINNVLVRTRIAEIVHRQGRGHPKIREPFLTSTPSLAHRPVATAQEVN